MRKFDTVESLAEFLRILKSTKLTGETKNIVVEEIAIQSLNLKKIEELVLSVNFSKCLFLGCMMSDDLLHHLLSNNFIFPLLEVPFNTYPNRLYNKDSLYNDFDYHNPETYVNTQDKIIYDYFQQTLEKNSIRDSLAQRLHDHSITDTMHEFISNYDERRLVAIMGGHKVKRTDAMYLQIARLSKTLTENGYLMLSGGGPGAMEATHFGAWMSGRTEEELLRAAATLAEAPVYSDKYW